MTILVESFAGYRRITLNRPERLNALTVEMAAALAAALDDAVADKTCRAILLTGAGRGFCAGQDLTEIIGVSPADLDRLLAHYHPLILKIRALPIPVVCAVNGVAAGAGANLALACDILVAARSAQRATTRSRNSSISKANCSARPALIPIMPRVSAPFWRSARLPSRGHEAERRSPRCMPAPAKMGPVLARKSAQTCDKVT